MNIAPISLTRILCFSWFLRVFIACLLRLPGQWTVYQSTFISWNFFVSLLLLAAVFNSTINAQHIRHKQVQRYLRPTFDELNSMENEKKNIEKFVPFNRYLPNTNIRGKRIGIQIGSDSPLILAVMYGLLLYIVLFFLSLSLFPLHVLLCVNGTLFGSGSIDATETIANHNSFRPENYLYFRLLSTTFAKSWYK